MIAKPRRARPGLSIAAVALSMLLLAAVGCTANTVAPHSGDAPAPRASATTPPGAAAPASSGATPVSAQATAPAPSSTVSTANTPAASTPAPAADAGCPPGGTPMARNPHDLLSQILAQTQSTVNAAGAACSVFASSSSGAGGTSVSVSTSNDSSGMARATVLVRDAAGKGVPGAHVDGSVQLTSGGQTRSLTFPPTDSNGRTSVAVQVPAGQGTTVRWTVRVASGGSTSVTTAQTYVP